MRRGLSHGGNDSRLRFNGTKDGGCEDKLHYTVDAGQPQKLWGPDVYFKNARQNHLGLSRTAQRRHSTRVIPRWRRVYVAAPRLTVNCAMNLGRLQWDQQICGVNLGVFSETAEQVQLAWTSKNVEGARILFSSVILQASKRSFISRSCL